MKIGIVTHHRALNAGAVFQAFALQTYLQKQGYEVIFIDFREPENLAFADFVGKTIGRMCEKLEDRYFGWYYSRNHDFWKVLNFSSKCYTSIEELRESPPVCDLYISGSDQVWNVGSWGHIKSHFFLDFSDDTKKISYAASMGQAEIPDHLRDDLKDVLAKFEFISVREDKPQMLLTELFENKRQIYKTPDPTLLLKAADYASIIDGEELPTGEFIFSYVLADYHHRNDFKNAFDHISEKTQKRIINIKNPDTCLRIPGYKNKVVTPYQWLNYMKHSSFAICSSFHAVVFALLFHKPFIVLQSYKNVRIQSLLKPLGLLSRCVFSPEIEKFDNIIESPINWEDVDKRLNDTADIGKEFLKMAIGN